MIKKYNDCINSTYLYDISIKMYNGQNSELHYRNGIDLPRICWYTQFDNNHSVYDKLPQS